MGVKVVDVIAVIEKGSGKDIVKKETGFTVKSLVKVDMVDGNIVIEGSAAD